MSKLQDIVNLERYPIMGIEGLSDQKTAEFAQQCRDQYLQHGVLLLADFLTPFGLETMATEARNAAPKSYRKIKQHTVYLAQQDVDFAEEHPRFRQLITNNSTVADCDIQSDAALRRLYNSPEIRQFFATVTDKPSLYPYTDPLSPLNLGVTRDGETLSWHFDKSDFAITLLLQSAQSGGAFEYVPRIRSDDEHNYSAIEQLLNGDQSSTLTLHMQPGTLVLFQGRYSIHRVTQVHGHRDRLLAVLSYDEQPGQRMSEFTQRTFYGRSA